MTINYDAATMYPAKSSDTANYIIIIAPGISADDGRWFVGMARKSWPDGFLHGGQFAVHLHAVFRSEAAAKEWVQTTTMLPMTFLRNLIG
jgi:hypothetical protein